MTLGGGKESNLPMFLEHFLKEEMESSPPKTASLNRRRGLENTSALHFPGPPVKKPAMNSSTLIGGSKACEQTKMKASSRSRQQITPVSCRIDQIIDGSDDEESRERWHRSSPNVGTSSWQNDGHGDRQRSVKRENYI